MQCQSPKCNRTISRERMEAQPNTKTCGDRECKKEYYNWYHREYRKRKASK